ncbi:MAG: phosphoribosylglycinamide formyltransferase [Planctomycetota bacterium]|nr:MAG: phosphoribosylglycinamide formyltransferase [Planctomycetota bacterium]HIC24082.1 phosphoribosylglycinamide formyltransferase [Planctomycetota bacterium]
MSTETAKIGFLLSGGGRTLENLVEVIEQRSLAARICLVISNRSGIGGLERARRLGIPSQIHPCKNTEGSVEIFQALDEAGCQWALLGGWLRKLVVPPEWLGRVVNIHPSLLPRHGGAGCYGDHVHRRVLEGGDSTTGCTVHFVDDDYDHGPVILQEEIPVLPDDTVESLGSRVFEAEIRAYPKALEKILAGEAIFDRI